MLFLGGTSIIWGFQCFFRKELFKNFIVLSVCAVAALSISSYSIANLLPGSPEQAQILHEQQGRLKSLNMSGYLEDNLGSLASSDKGAIAPGILYLRPILV